jgi:hypothetical protein
MYVCDSLIENELTIFAWRLGDRGCDLTDSHGSVRFDGADSEGPLSKS